jgi:hypothetical protein
MFCGKQGVTGGVPQIYSINCNPFSGPKLHLYKKNASRRIKTSSVTRNQNVDVHFPPNILAPLNNNSISPNTRNANPYNINENLPLNRHLTLEASA